jgi:hypothetical protein
MVSIKVCQTAVVSKQMHQVQRAAVKTAANKEICKKDTIKKDKVINTYKEKKQIL